MNRQAWSAVLLSIVLLGNATAHAAAPPPDLTGIWSWDTEKNKGAGRTSLPWPEKPPWTQEAREKVTAYRALVEPSGTSPGAFCLGTGMPGSTLGSGGYPMEIIQRPEQITIIHEAHNELRRIYLGGRKIDPNDLFPSRNGYSTGRWEGDTLVVETMSLKEQVDQTAAHTEDARILERFSVARDSKGRRILTLQMTLTDPRFYTAPVTVTKTWVEAPKGRMLDYECNEPAWEDHLKKLTQKAE